MNAAPLLLSPFLSVVVGASILLPGAEPQPVLSVLSVPGVTPAASSRHQVGAGPAAPGPVSAPSAGTRAGSRWSWPLRPRPAVVHRFSAPAGRYGPGHRGIDLDAVLGRAVTAVDAGRVSHVGVVAGRGTVTLRHRSGLRSTYEPVRSSLHVGDQVARGESVGVLEPGSSHCVPAACLHLGALQDSAYLDPLPLLRPARVILLPVG